MLAIRKLAREVGNIEVQDMPEPSPGPDQVVIKVDSAGIYGTDLHIYYDEFETRPPVTIGHEVAGQIAELGRDVRGWKTGDRVTETYFYTCGECGNCRWGRRNLCLQRRSIGSKEDGAFAEYLLTPASDVIRVPEDLDLESAALTEPLACVVHGVLQTSHVEAGDNVAITGPGPIGLLALQVVKSAGATAIMIGTNEDRERLTVAKELGADGVINVQEVGDTVGWVTEIFKGIGADVVIECSGAASAAKTLTNIAARGARFCQMGLYGKTIPFDQDAVCYKELIVTGTNASVKPAWSRALKLLSERRVNAGRPISHRFGLGDWEKALEVVKNKEGIKIILKPNG